MQLIDGVTLNIIQTEKFKDIGISFRFRNTLDKEHAPARSLLALLLCDRCQKYDTKQKMSAQQDQLYGATLSAQTTGYGASQTIEIRSRIINPSYINSQNNLLEDTFSFLHEVIFNPLLEEDVFQESKQILLAKYERLMDEPSQYAITQGLKLAGENTPLGISALGEKENIQSLTLQNVKDAYYQMIKTDAIDIIVCGDVDEKKLQEIIKNTFVFVPRNCDAKTYYAVNNTIEKDHYFDYRNISQSYIMMTWFTNTTIVDDDYYALRVANAMLGQYSTSLLFQEVREKNSLCYSIFSNLISYDGALGVTTGVEKENVDKTKKLIFEQMETLQKGEFSEELLSVSKQMIINSLRASEDNMLSMIALCYQNCLLHKNDKSFDIIKLVESVQKEDILRVINKLQYKLTLIVTKEDANEGDN